MRTRMHTGDLRAALQPIVFLQLLAPVATVDGGTAFNVDDIVSAQYWGGGHVVLSRYPDGRQAVAVAHDVDAVPATVTS